MNFSFSLTEKTVQSISKSIPCFKIFKNFHTFIHFHKPKLGLTSIFYDKRLTFFLNSLAKFLLFFLEIGTMEVRKILEESNGMDNRTSVQTV